MLIPNKIYFSRKFKEQYPHIAREIEAKLKIHGIKPNWLDQTNDIWVRDLRLTILSAFSAGGGDWPDKTASLEAF